MFKKLRAAFNYSHHFLKYVNSSFFIIKERNRSISEKKIAEFCRKICTVGQKKKERNTPIYFNTNYRTGMKLVPIIMDYWLFQFDALKLFFGVRLHRGSLPNLIFSV